MAELSERVQRRLERNAEVFAQRLEEALKVARAGNVAVVITPPLYSNQLALNILVRLLDPAKDWNAATDSHMLHFFGTRGSVRLYPADHFTYDARAGRLVDYPASVPHFLHPDVEGL